MKILILLIKITKNVKIKNEFKIKTFIKRNEENIIYIKIGRIKWILFIIKKEKMIKIPKYLKK